MELPIAGVYSGKLSNNGEQFTIADALGLIIQTLKYDDGWYRATDGDEYSLVAIDPENADPNDFSMPARWTLSEERGGSPGDG